MNKRREAKPKGAAPDAFTKGRNPLTYEDAKRLAGLIEYHTSGGQHDLLALVYLLAYSLAYEEDRDAREGMLIGFEFATCTSMAGYDKMLDGELRRSLGNLRKGDAKR